MGLLDSKFTIPAPATGNESIILDVEAYLEEEEIDPFCKTCKVKGDPWHDGRTLSVGLRLKGTQVFKVCCQCRATCFECDSEIENKTNNWIDIKDMVFLTDNQALAIVKELERQQELNLEVINETTQHPR